MRKSVALLLVLVFLTAPCLIAIKSVSAASQDSWATKAPMPTARSGLGTAVVQGKIFAIGGGSVVNEMYDPAADT